MFVGLGATTFPSSFMKMIIPWIIFVSASRADAVSGMPWFPPPPPLRRPRRPERELQPLSRALRMRMRRMLSVSGWTEPSLAAPAARLRPSCAAVLLWKSGIGGIMDVLCLLWILPSVWAAEGESVGDQLLLVWARDKTPWREHHVVFLPHTCCCRRRITSAQHGRTQQLLRVCLVVNLL